jgi:hypothetical protein
VGGAIRARRRREASAYISRPYDDADQMGQRPPVLELSYDVIVPSTFAGNQHVPHGLQRQFQRALYPSVRERDVLAGEEDAASGRDEVLV